MYPFLNTDYNSSTRKDVVGVNMWKAGEAVRRGDVVVFRSVALHLLGMDQWEDKCGGSYREKEITARRRRWRLVEGQKGGGGKGAIWKGNRAD